VQSLFESPSLLPSRIECVADRANGKEMIYIQGGVLRFLRYLFTGTCKFPGNFVGQ
jgi:hypothetical protein